MKQKGVILLVTILLMNISPLKELLRIPFVVMHYIEHLEEFPDMTWREFFSMHYIMEMQIDDDFHKDIQLPFKTLEYNQIPSFLVVEHQDLSSISIGIFAFDESKIAKPYQFLINDAHLRGIFHPPQFI